MEVMPRRRIGTKSWTADGTLSVSEIPIEQKNLANGPDGDRRAKKKSDPGRSSQGSTFGGIF